MLRSALEELANDDPTTRSHDELRADVVEIARAIDVLTHLLRVRTVEVATRASFADDGFLNVTRWLAATADIDDATARRHVAMGKTLGETPEVARRSVAGDLSGARVRLLARAAAAHPDPFRRDEAMLVGFAERFTLRNLRRAIDHWINCADATRAELTAGQQREAAYLHASRTFDGMVKIDGLLDKETGEVVLTALDAAMTPFARSGSGSGEARPAPQRRAEAFGEICRGFLDHHPGVIGGQRPHVSLIVDLETLQGRLGSRCEQAHTGTITAGTARRILCDAAVSRVIVNGDSAPLDMGRTVRTATPAQLRALAIRDGGCTHPGCERPAPWCDAHHVVHWLDGGPTDLANLVLLCRRHHGMVHGRTGTAGDDSVLRE